jgi:hypothetical protein
MPDPLFVLDGTPYPVVWVRPLGRRESLRRMHSGHVGSSMVVAGAGNPDERARGWEVRVGDQLTEGEADALIQLLLSPGFRTAGGLKIGHPAECSVARVRYIPGALLDMASVDFTLLPRDPGGADLLET